MTEVQNRPETTTGDMKLAALDKVAFGQRFDVSKRTVDHWLRLGLPHLKLSERAVRIPLPDADEWVRNRFLTQRHGKFASKNSQPGSVK